MVCVNQGTGRAVLENFLIDGAFYRLRLPSEGVIVGAERKVIPVVCYKFDDREIFFSPGRSFDSFQVIDFLKVKIPEGNSDFLAGFSKDFVSYGISRLHEMFDGAYDRSMYKEDRFRDFEEFEVNN